MVAGILRPSFTPYDACGPLGRCLLPYEQRVLTAVDSQARKVKQAAHLRPASAARMVAGILRPSSTPYSARAFLIDRTVVCNACAHSKPVRLCAACRYGCMLSGGNGSCDAEAAGV